MKVIKSLLFLSLFVLLLMGCIGSPYEISRMDQTELSQVSDYQLLGALSNSAYRTEMMFNEAKRRGLLNDNDIRIVKSGRLQTGMSENALIATWGHPVNIKTDTWHHQVIKQYIYGFKTKYTSQTYVIVNQGTVRSWHEKKK